MTASIMANKAHPNQEGLQKLAAVLFALGVWQTAAMLLHQGLLLASPVQVLMRLTTIWREPDFAAKLWFSFARIVSGFFLGLVCGILLAVPAGRFRLIENLLWPLMLTVKSVPVASFIVLALIWLSSAQLSVFISFLMVLPIVYSNMLSGIRSIDPKMNEMADVFCVPSGRRFMCIWLPHIKPFLMSACNVALGLAWKSGIAAEIIGIPDGSVGEALYNAKVYLNSEDLLAWTVIVVLVSVVFEKLFMALLAKGFAALNRI